METPDKTKSPLGGLTVLELLTTKALVLLVFSFTHQWLHHFWILAKSLLREAATAGRSAGLRTTLSNVETSAYRHIVCSLPAQTFHRNKGWTEEDQTHFPVAHQKRLGYILTSSTINHDCLPAVGEELLTNGQRTATYTNRFNLAALSRALSGSTKLNNMGLHPWI